MNGQLFSDNIGFKVDDSPGVNLTHLRSVSQRDQKPCASGAAQRQHFLHEMRGPQGALATLVCMAALCLAQQPTCPPGWTAYRHLCLVVAPGQVQHSDGPSACAGAAGSGKAGRLASFESDLDLQGALGALSVSWLPPVWTALQRGGEGKCWAWRRAGCRPRFTFHARACHFDVCRWRSVLA